MVLLQLPDVALRQDRLHALHDVLRVSRVRNQVALEVPCRVARALLTQCVACLRPVARLLHEVVVHDRSALVGQVSCRVLPAAHALTVGGVLAGGSQVRDDGASLLARGRGLRGLHHVDRHVTRVVQKDFGVQVVSRAVVL